MARSLLYNRHTGSITYFQVTISTRLVALPAPQAWLSVDQGFPALVSANAQTPLRPPQQPRPYRNQAEISDSSPMEGLQLSPNVLEHLRWWGNPVVLHPMLCCNTLRCALLTTLEPKAAFRSNINSTASRNKLPWAPGPLFWCGRAPVAGSAALFSVLRPDSPVAGTLLVLCCERPQPPSDFSIRIRRPSRWRLSARPCSLTHHFPTPGAGGWQRVVPRGPAAVQPFFFSSLVTTQAYSH